MRVMQLYTQSGSILAKDYPKYIEYDRRKIVITLDRLQQVVESPDLILDIKHKVASCLTQTHDFNLIARLDAITTNKDTSNEKHIVSSK